MKKIFALCMTITAMLLTLTACGKNEVPADVLPEYVYVPQYIELKDENVQLWNAQILDGKVYYLENTWDEETMTNVTNICQVTISDTNELSVDKSPLELGENVNANSFALDKDGNRYFLLNKWSPEGGSESSLFSKYDKDGNQIYETDVTAELNKDEEHNYINGIAVDDEGNLYAYTQDMVRLIDASGKYAGEITANDWINNIGRGKDGKVYLTYWGVNGAELAAIDFNGKKIGEGCSNFPNGNGNFLVSGYEKDFMVSDGQSVMEYDASTQTSTTLFKWLDSDINGDHVSYVGPYKDGKLIAMMNDWQNNKSEIAILTKTKSADLPKKEPIVIGTLYVDQNLQMAAVNFNKANEKYHVYIRNYFDNNNHSETAWEDAQTRLNNDITASNSGLDMIDVSQINIREFAAKGVFEDLTPYLEKSTVLDKDDYFENILDGYRYGNTLIAIPTSFSLQTVIGKTSDVGDKMGWTLSDLIALGEKNPGKEIFDRVPKSSIMQYCLSYNIDSFVNWETGECKFDSPEFKQILEFANTFPDEVDWESDQRSQPAKIQDGDVLLAQAYIGDLNSIQEYIGMFNAPVTCIGYPTTDGSAGCVANASETYAMFSKSKNKEGVWEFMEYYQAESSDRYRWALPTQKSKFEEIVEQETKVEYMLDENGEQMLDGDGNPIPMNGGSSVSYGDWEYEYHTPTKEEADLIRELIAVAKPANSGSVKLNEIINEEAEGFFAGQKTVDEVAAVIQSRAKIFVSENS